MLSNRLKAAGFVEALLSIVVAGIASIVLMGIAADTQIQVLRNDASDSMTQEAVRTAEMVRKVADLHNNGDEELFPDLSQNRNNCFAMEGSLDNPQFPTNDGENIVSTCSLGDRDSCITDDLAEYFSVYCLTDDTDVDAGLAVGKVVSGLVKCTSEDTKGICRLSDYEYYIVVRITK